MKKLLLAALVAGTTLGGIAHAAQDAPAGAMRRGGSGGGGGMMLADTNHDGRIDRAEYQTMVDQRFAQMDVNRDGRITADERHGRRAMAAREPGRAPRSIDQAAFRHAALTRFDRLDGNHDGVIDAQELAAMRDMMRFRMAGRGGPAERGNRGGMADTDHDGRVSRAEFVAQAGQRFDRVDANRDGYIDPAERARTRGRVRQPGAPAMPPPPAPPAPPGQ